MERLFNSIPQKIRNIEEKNVETFKKHLDKWLKTVPDTPRIDDYGNSGCGEQHHRGPGS